MLGSKQDAVVILDAATATGAGVVHRPWGHRRTYEAQGTTSAGAGAAVIVIQVCNDGSSWKTLGTFSLTLGTTSTTDGFASSAAWKYVRANVSSISGTTATVSVYLGC